MQLRPVPEVVWRTAKKAHQLGGVDVATGDKVAVAIVSATQELLFANTVDVKPVFGGDRDDITHGTHTCPALKMGMGVLLGMVTGLMQAGPVWPTASALALTWRGTV
jgi:hypothetical protein